MVLKEFRNSKLLFYDLKWNSIYERLWRSQESRIVGFDILGPKSLDKQKVVSNA